MDRSFSLMQAAFCALVLASAGLSALPAQAQSSGGFQPYHYEPYHFGATQTQPYQFQPFHSTYDHSSDYHSTYDWSPHSSDSEKGPADPYHPFTMDPPYAPSSTPKYKYENGTITGPSGPVWHDNLGHVDVGALQKRGADVTFHDPFFAPKAGETHSAAPEDPFAKPKAPFSLRPGFDEKEHEKYNDAPPGPYGSQTPIVNPVAPSGN